MEDLDIAAVTKRSIHGVLALVSRTFVVQIISFVSNFFLTIKLNAEVFGVYYVVTAVIAFLAYFSDIGFAAALIQKKEEITEEDLRTTFTIQQILVISIVAIAVLLSPGVGSFYNLDSRGIFLFQALAIAFFLSSLKTIPSVILERNLHFDKLVIPQIAETLSFSIVVVLLAFLNFGIDSFTYAVLARGVIGVLVIYAIAPWKVGIGFSKKSASKLFSFGIPFQTNSLLALLKDDLLILYLGTVLSFTQVGYIGFAQKWAFQPLRLVMDNVIRVTFPSFSRLQGNKASLGIAVEKSLFASCLAIFPLVFGVVILSPFLINLFPQWTKWQPALISLLFFSGNALFSSISTPLTNFLNAIGKIRITLQLMIFWTVATWLTTIFGIKIFGFNGVSIASFVVSLSAVLVVYIARKHIEFKVFRPIMPPLIASSVMGVILYIIAPRFVSNIFALLVVAAIGGAVYFVVLYAIAHEEIQRDIATVKRHLRNPS